MKKLLAGVAATALIGTGLILPSLASQASNGVPAYDHIVVVVMENESSTNIVGSSSAPYINSLATNGANFTDAHAEAHPSQPNYVAMFSGDTHGVTDDSSSKWNFSGENLATQLTAAGKTFAGYSEGKNSGVNWKAYHSPWLHWTGTPSSQQLDWTQFPTDYTQLPNVSIVVPDACNDMHDCSISTGDTWLKDHMDAYAQWAKTHNSLLYVTWDEDGGTGGTTAANHIAAVAQGANLVQGQHSGWFNHYGLLGMIEDSQGLPRLGNAVGASFPTDAFGTAPTQTPTATPTPTPTSTTGTQSTNDGNTAAAALGWGDVVAGDEFNYTGAPDSTKWNLYNSAGHNGNGIRTPSADYVNVDHLTIAGDANGTTGGMSSKFAQQQYGRWEARIRTNATEPKYHAVSILWPSANDSAKCAEIDYSEQASDVANDHFYLHSGCSSPTTSASKAIDLTQWHNFAVDWSPSGITGYIDGVQWFQDNDLSHLPDVAMHQTFQLDWFPVAGETTTPSWMDVDWVRVYAPAGSAATASPTPTPTPTPTSSPGPTAPAPPAHVSVLLTPGANAGDYRCSTDYPAANSTCVLILPPNVADPNSTLGQVHLDPGADGRYTCTVDYPGYPEVPCDLTTQG